MNKTLATLLEAFIGIRVGPEPGKDEKPSGPPAAPPEGAVSTERAPEPAKPEKPAR